MGSIAIITDTDASLPAEIAARHGIRQVPINILFGTESYETGIDIDDAQTFARIDREGVLPTTSAPSPGQFVEAFEGAFDAGAEAAICFCVSSKVSATYSAALAARETMPERDISVVDTLSLSMGQGFMALAAAEAAAQGATVDQAVARAVAVRERTSLYAALSTLKYLAMSGRVGSLAAGMANLLNVKPILTIADGTLDLLEKVRAQRRAWARTIELTEQTVGDRAIERMAIIHVNVPEEARRFQEQVLAALPYQGDVIVAEVTPGLSVHSGAGMVGVVVVAGE
ncbi:MAG: DegV family protein [Anaerolineae bacterium]|nr:DegV family protein [Anaerolineae bacterium]